MMHSLLHVEVIRENLNLPKKKKKLFKITFKSLNKEIKLKKITTHNFLQKKENKRKKTYLLCFCYILFSEANHRASSSCKTGRVLF